MPFTIGLGSVHRVHAFRIVDTGNSKRCHRLEKLKYSPPVGMRLRVASSTNLCRLRTVTSAAETEAETDCETGLLPEVSPQALVEMERVRNSKDASTSATPPLSGHRRNIKVMGLPLSPELVAISLGTVLQPRAASQSLRLCMSKPSPGIGTLGQICGRHPRLVVNAAHPYAGLTHNCILCSVLRPGDSRSGAPRSDFPVQG